MGMRNFFRKAILFLGLGFLFAQKAESASIAESNSKYIPGKVHMVKYRDKPLNKRQLKARAKEKRAREARKINFIHQKQGK